MYDWMPKKPPKMTTMTPSTILAISPENFSWSVCNMSRRSETLVRWPRQRTARNRHSYTFKQFQHSRKKRAPITAPFQIVAEWTGLEPATPGVTGRYSNQLNYHSAFSELQARQHRPCF